MPETKADGKEADGATGLDGALLKAVVSLGGLGALLFGGGWFFEAGFSGAIGLHTPWRGGVNDFLMTGFVVALVLSVFVGTGALLATFGCAETDWPPDARPMAAWLTGNRGIGVVLLLVTLLLAGLLLLGDDTGEPMLALVLASLLVVGVSALAARSWLKKSPGRLVVAFGAVVAAAAAAFVAGTVNGHGALARWQNLDVVCLQQKGRSVVEDVRLIRAYSTGFAVRRPDGVVAWVREADLERQFAPLPNGRCA